jgi:hypothetical protein
MTWGEVRTRLGQAASKRLDLVAYWAGAQFSPSLRQNGIQPKFFFDHQGGDLAERASLLHSYLPGEAEAIIQDADNVCRHKLCLLGYENINYGPSIDWHSDPVHGKRSPLRPWFRIPFLNFDLIGDHKIIWELNRHQHLVTLAKAWALTGNPAYVKECLDQFYSWQKHNPYPLGINWASTLEVAFRTLSWLWVRFMLASCPECPLQFETDLLSALQSNGRYIERYLSTFFSPNTHLLGEVVALFFLGTLCPEISVAERWQRNGWSSILRESKRQVRSDGVYFEQSLYYHVYALDFFLHARVLAAKNRLEIPEAFDNVIQRMLGVLQALSASGPPEGFGDDDGGRIFNPRRNRVEHMTDPLSLGAVLYGSSVHSNTGVTEEAIWLFGAEAIKALARPQPEISTSAKALQDGGVYVMYDRDPCPQQMWLDGGPQGTGNAGHGHADALSVRYSLDRHRILIDSGTYCYVSDHGDRNQFRGTAAHNALIVDGLDQAVPEGPFAWSLIPNVKVEAWMNGATFDFFVGSHDGYRRLQDPVLHRRFVFHVKGGFWLVRDLADGRGNHRLESFWHFAPDLKVRVERGMLTEVIRDADPQSVRLVLLLEEGALWKQQVTDMPISPAYGAKQSAPAVRVHADTALPADCGVLLVPVFDSGAIGTLTAVGDCSADGVRGYRYQTSLSTEFIFFASGATAWTWGEWKSDAELLYCKIEANRLAQAIMLQGSFVEWRGQKLISHPSRAKIFEWVSNSPVENASSKGRNLSGSGVVADPEVFGSVS